MASEQPDITEAELEEIYDKAEPFDSEEEMDAAIDQLNAYFALAKSALKIERTINIRRSETVEKANPYHDERGRFTSANAAVGGAGKRSGATGFVSRGFSRRRRERGMGEGIATERERERSMGRKIVSDGTMRRRVRGFPMDRSGRFVRDGSADQKSLSAARRAASRVPDSETGRGRQRVTLSDPSVKSKGRSGKAKRKSSPQQRVQEARRKGKTKKGSSKYKIIYADGQIFRIKR